MQGNDWRLFYNKNKRQYFLYKEEEEEVFCCHCKTKINDVGTIFRLSNKPNQFILRCTNCYDKDLEYNHLIVESFMVIITESLPKDSNYVFFTRMSLSQSKNLSVFDIADNNIGNEKIIDKTLHCHNPNFMVNTDKTQKEARLEARKKCRELDKPRYNKDLDKHFNEVLDMKPAIEEKKIKRLEVKDD